MMGAPGGVASGLAVLDQVLGGLRAGEVSIVAARPSMGKTALATTIAAKVAAGGTAVAFFSLEMPGQAIAARLLGDGAGISAHRLQRGWIAAADFDGPLWAARETVRNLPLFIDDTAALSVSALRTRARRLKRQQDLGLVVVDYLQLMQPPTGKRSENRVQEVSEITRGLKALAKDLDVPVLALSQLSRQVEQREDKRPQLADLRESGSIEQDADLVMFIYREEYYLARAEPSPRAGELDGTFEQRRASWQARLDKVQGRAEVIVAKNRNGPLATVNLAFDASLTRFRDPDASAEAAA